jgi:hypothetical protein
MKKYFLPFLLFALACIGQGFPPEPLAIAPSRKRARMAFQMPFLMHPPASNAYIIHMQPDGSGIVTPFGTNVWLMPVYPGKTVTLTQMPLLDGTNTLWLITNRHNLMLLEVSDE